MIAGKRIKVDLLIDSIPTIVATLFCSAFSWDKRERVKCMIAYSRRNFASFAMIVTEPKVYSARRWGELSKYNRGRPRRYRLKVRQNVYDISGS